MQAESERENSAIRERIAIIDRQLDNMKEQLSRLLDLYLSGDFPKDLLVNRRAQLESAKRDLTRELSELQTHYESVTFTEFQRQEIEILSAQISDGLE